MDPCHTIEPVEFYYEECMQNMNKIRKMVSVIVDIMKHANKSHHKPIYFLIKFD